MESGSVGAGCIAVIAVSGSVVFIAREVHKRLLSDYMKKIEIEFDGIEKCQMKRRVRFAEDVIEPSSNNEEYRNKNHQGKLNGDDHGHGHDHGHDYGHGHVHVHKRSSDSSMPLNRQVLYKGIIEYKTLTKTHQIF